LFLVLALVLARYLVCILLPDQEHRVIGPPLFVPLALVCDNLCSVCTCSASPHDDQELPQGSPWRAQELGPRLRGSLQLDHGHLLTGKPCHWPVRNRLPSNHLCHRLSSNIAYLAVSIWQRSSEPEPVWPAPPKHREFDQSCDSVSFPCHDY
jgi:hypothetical protein